MAKTEGIDVSALFEDEAGAGFENVTQQDIGVPILKIVQKSSPEVDEQSEGYDSKYKVGQIIDNISGEIYSDKDDVMAFVPCAYIKAYPEWTPRDKGGGFVFTHSDESVMADTTKNDKGVDIRPNGNEVKPTAYFTGLITDRGEGIEDKPVVIALQSTQLKKARKWLGDMTSIRLDGKKGKFTPPMYAFKHNISTVPEKNDKGSWMGWKIDRGDMVDSPALLTMAKGARAQATRLLSAPTEATAVSEVAADAPPF